MLMSWLFGFAFIFIAIGLLGALLTFIGEKISFIEMLTFIAILIAEFALYLQLF